MMQDQIMRFCRLRLGMKPVIDYVQSRSKLLGIATMPIKTVFDVGANVGKKSRQYRKLFPEANIYSFEPVPATYEKLCHWARHQKGAVQAFNLALGSEIGQSTIHWNREHSGGSTVLLPDSSREHEYVSVDVRMETLDCVAERLAVRDQVLVKIDVEGFDLEVIKGGQALLRRAAAVIVEIGLEDSSSGLPMFRDFANIMHDLGYAYRGNLSHGYVNGIARHADAVFTKPQSPAGAVA